MGPLQEPRRPHRQRARQADPQERGRRQQQRQRHRDPQAQGQRQELRRLERTAPQSMNRRAERGELQLCPTPKLYLLSAPLILKVKLPAHRIRRSDLLHARSLVGILGAIVQRRSPSPMQILILQWSRRDYKYANLTWVIFHAKKQKNLLPLQVCEFLRLNFPGIRREFLPTFDKRFRFARRMDHLGGHISAFTSKEETILHFLQDTQTHK